MLWWAWCVAEVGSKGQWCRWNQSGSTPPSRPSAAAWPASSCATCAPAAWRADRAAGPRWSSRPGRFGLSGCASCAVGTGSAVLGEVLGVDDGVGVALLGQEALAVGGVLLVGGVAGDDRVEVGLAAVLLGAHDPPEPLGLLLARAEGA